MVSFWNPGTSGSPASVRQRFGIALVVFAIACLGHVLQIGLFARALPFADQWDSEGYLLFKQWQEGTLSIAQLFGLHNEHRIALTRLLDLVVISLNNGYWDNRAIALVNTLVYALAIAGIAAAASAMAQKAGRRIVYAVCLLLPFAPYTYENTLWGFQSQFHFLALTSVFSFAIASRDDYSVRRAAALLALGLLSLVTVASGFLVPALCSVVVLGMRSPANARAPKWITSGALLLIAGFGAYLVPHLAYHDQYRAQSLAEWLLATWRLLSWPTPYFPLLWLPSALWAILVLAFRKPVSRCDRFFICLTAWIVASAVVLGYGRGHDLVLVPSRYLEFLSLGLISNSYFACCLFQGFSEIRLRALVRGAVLGAAGLVFAYSVVEAGRYWMVSRHKSDLSLANVEVADAMLASTEVPLDHFALPYPDRAKLARYFADPTLRKLVGVRDTTIPDPCDPALHAPLSQLVCSLQSLFGVQPLPRFRPTGDDVGSAGTSHCALDRLFGTTQQGIAIVTPREVPIRIAGWVGPNTASTPVFTPAILLLDGAPGRYSAQTGWRFRRADVVQTLKSPDFAWSGFDQIVSLRGLPPGDYRVYAKNGPTGEACDLGFTLSTR